MSETDIPIMPSPSEIYPNGDIGFIRYRPAFTSLSVQKRPKNGRKLSVNDDGRIVTFDLNAGQAEVLSSMLRGDPA